MILNCAVKDLNVKTIISSPIEHHAVIHALDALKKIKKLMSGIKTNAQGNIDLNDLKNLKD